VTPCAGREARQTHIADTDARQFGDRVADSGQHSPYLPVAALKDGEFHFGPAFAGRIGGGSRNVFFVIGSGARETVPWEWDDGRGLRRARRGSGHRLLGPHAHVLRARDRAVVEHHAARQAAHGIGRRYAAHFRTVRLRNMILGMGQVIQKIAVIREEDQAHTLSVQTTDWAQHGA